MTADETGETGEIGAVGDAEPPTEPLVAGEAATADVAKDGATRLYPDPNGPGYADPALLAGRPASSYLHLGALLLAGAADVGAFYEVIARVLGRTPGPLVYLVVLGFTGTVMYLAHVTGVLLRNWRAKMRFTSPWAALVCLVVLAVLGAVAYQVRLYIPTSGPILPTTISATGGPAAPTDDRESYAALVFLALYCATVAVAAVGAYLTHNPLQEGYHTAVRMFRKWSAQAGVAHAAFLAAEGREASERANREAAIETLNAQIQRNTALGEELKQRARVRLLAAAQDPAVTDAWMKSS